MVSEKDKDQGGSGKESQDQDSPPPPAKPLTEEHIERGQGGSEHTRQDEAQSDE